MIQQESINLELSKKCIQATPADISQENKDLYAMNLYIIAKLVDLSTDNIKISNKREQVYCKIIADLELAIIKFDSVLKKLPKFPDQESNLADEALNQMSKQLNSFYQKLINGYISGHIIHPHPPHLFLPKIFNSPKRRTKQQATPQLSIDRSIIKKFLFMRINELYLLLKNDTGGKESNFYDLYIHPSIFKVINNNLQNEYIPPKSGSLRKDVQSFRSKSKLNDFSKISTTHTMEVAENLGWPKKTLSENP